MGKKQDQNCGDKAMAGNTESDGGRRGGWRKAVWGTAVFLWLLPLVAMQFTAEVNWDETDFIVWGVILSAAAGTYELAARMTRNSAYRIAVGIAIVAAFLLVWINGAVGIIGSEANPANLMYFGVLAVGVIGTLIARFRPHGMGRALFAMATAQMLIPVIALITWSPDVTSWGAAGVVGVFFLNAAFAMLFVGSALMFRRATNVRLERGAV